MLITVKEHLNRFSKIAQKLMKCRKLSLLKNMPKYWSRKRYRTFFVTNTLYAMQFCLYTF